MISKPPIVGTFVTLGNLERRFDRLINTVLEAYDALPKPVLIQYGGTSPSAELLQVSQGNAVSFVDYVDHSSFNHHIKSSSLVIGHAGVGTLLTCQLHGKTPLMMSRRKMFGEHIDDHQVEFLALAVSRCDALAIEAMDDIPCKADQAVASIRIAKRSSPIIVDLKNYLDSLR